MEITEKYLSFSYKIVTGKIFMLALIIFIIFLSVILPWESERSGKRLGFEKSPDSSFIYSQTELYEMAEAYGEEGRSYYIRSRFSFDIIWPLAYFFFLWSGMALILKNFPSRMVRSLLLLPFLGILFDFLENLGASLVMYRYPVESFLIDQLTPGFTLFKWTFIYLSFIVLLLGSGIRLYHKIKS
ncbi:MAG: hypothetical protein ACOCZY_00400 [Bacillota bacterium]